MTCKKLEIPWRNFGCASTRIHDASSVCLPSRVDIPSPKPFRLVARGTLSASCWSLDPAVQPSHLSPYQKTHISAGYQPTPAQTVSIQNDYKLHIHSFQCTDTGLIRKASGLIKSASNPARGTWLTRSHKTATYWYFTTFWWHFWPQNGEHQSTVWVVDSTFSSTFGSGNARQWHKIQELKSSGDGRPWPQQT